MNQVKDFFFVPICAQNSLQEFLNGLFYYQKNWKTLKIEHDLEKAIHKQAIRYMLNRLISSRFKNRLKLYYDKCQFLENATACIRLSEFIQIYHRKSTKSVYTCSCITKYKWTNKKEKNLGSVYSHYYVHY